MRASSGLWAGWALGMLAGCSGSGKAPEDGDGPGADAADADTDTDTDVDTEGPQAIDDDDDVNEGGSVDVPVTVNDEAAAGFDLASVRVVDAPVHGTATPQADGTVTYLHDGGESTDDAFTYIVQDTQGATSNVAEVQVGVSPIDDPLVTAEDALQVDEGAVAIADVLANDVDPDDAIDPATLRVAVAPVHGTTRVLPGGTIEYTHNGDEMPADQFTYIVRNDDGDEAAPTLVSVTVLPVNDPPVARDDGGPAVDGGAINVPVTGNDLDADDGIDVSSVVVISPPAHGTAAVQADGSVTYTNDGLGEINDTFTYTIADFSGAVSNVALVTLSDNDCSTHPQWMPVTCLTTDWVWSRDRVLATDVSTAAQLGLLATGCNHSGNMQPDNGNGLCSLDGTGWVTVDQFPMTNCDTEWYHLGGSFSGNCGGHDTSAPVDLFRHLVIDPQGCFAY